MPNSTRIVAFAVLNSALNGLNYSFHWLTGAQMAPSDYGQLNGWLAWAAIVMVAGVSLQMAEAARVAAPQGPGSTLPPSPKLLRNTALGVSFFAGMTGLFGASDPGSGGVRALLLALLVASHLVLSWLRGQMQGRQQWGGLNLNSYVEVVVKLVAVGLLLAVWPSVEAGLVAVLLGHLASLLHAGLRRGSLEGWRRDVGSDRTSNPFSSGNWLNLIGTNLLMASFFAVDMIVVSFRFAEQSGAFAVAQKYGLLTAFLLSTLTTLALPSVRKASQSLVRLLKIIAPLLALAFLALVASVFSAMSWFPATVRSLFGEGYEGAIPLLPNACWAAGLLGLLQFVATLSTATSGRSPWGLLTLALTVVFGFSLVLEEPAQILQMESVIYGTTLLFLLVRWLREVRRGEDRS